MIITSTSNEKIKNVKKLIKSSGERNKQGLYIIEGIRMFKEIPKEQIASVFISEGMLSKYENELSLVFGKKVDEADDMINILPDKLFSQISDTITPQGILALVYMNKYTIEDIMQMSKTANSFYLIIERLQDPGNLGTIIRTSEAAGVTGIILSKDCVDLYNPKVVRSTMGAVLRVPVCVSDELLKDIDILKNNNITIFGAHLNGTEFYDKDYKRPCAFLIGNEGNGLSVEVSKKADELIKIPMLGKVESLNAATSTAVIAYEVLRQRR